MDADFKGTGLDVLVYAKNEDTFQGNVDIRLDELEKGKMVLSGNMAKNYFLFRSKYNKNSLNDYLNGNCHEIQEIVTESAVIARDSEDMMEENGDRIACNGYVDFIFSSSSIEARGSFSYENEQQPVMAVGQFRIRIERLLRQICDRAFVSGDKQYQHIVIDMPAGYDEYASIFLEVLRRFCHENKKEIYYYAVTTADKSHFDAMQEDVKDVLKGHSKYGKFNEVYTVFSETNEKEFKEYGLSYYRNKLLREVGDSVKCLKCLYKEDYYAYCRSDQKFGFGYDIGTLL